MDNVRLSIDGRPVEVPAGSTILAAARKAGVYIPVLCHHPDLPPVQTGRGARLIYRGKRRIENARPGEPAAACGICVVQIEGRGEPVSACSTPVENGMTVITCTDRITAIRREKLAAVMARHPHACLTCAQQEGCSRSQCSSNVPENERCCARFGHCELQNVANHVGIPDATARWAATDYPVISDQPLFERNDNLCIGCTRCVRACRDLRGVKAIGFVYDEEGRIQVGSLAPSLEQSGCRFCTACVQVCPTGALMDKAIRFSRRKQELVPCTQACPARIDVPAYLRMIAGGRTDKALAIVCERVPLPGVLGRVCGHPCEPVCRRAEVNEPVAICALKRFAADEHGGFWKGSVRVSADSGRKVAVIGAGPAGLTVAYYLRRQGHGICLFDANRLPGGMLRYGIPAYRLPRRVLDREISAVLALGIDFRPHRILGRDFTFAQLKQDGFEAIFLGVGAGRSRPVDLQGAAGEGVMGALEFLRRAAEGRNEKLSGRVVVIGGGNTAVDAARTALRRGAGEVKIACLESLDEMPAQPAEVERARQEGVQILACRGVDRIIHSKGRLSAVQLVECECVYDRRGSFCPRFGCPGELLPADRVILAVGQEVDFSFLDADSPFQIVQGRVAVDAATMETGVPGVYAGGDATCCGGSVIHAIAAGRRAAESIDRALGGSGDIDEILFERGQPEAWLGRREGFAALAREAVPELHAARRARNFREVVVGYGPRRAGREAFRCLQCDLRLSMGCNPDPPGRWLLFDEQHIGQTPSTGGVFQLADADYRVLSIKGTADLRRELERCRQEDKTALYFKFEPNRMYSQRESELIRKYLQAHGEMPGGSSGLDDLYF